MLYKHRFDYKWLCGIYVAYRRRKSGNKDKGTYGELAAKTRKLIEENTRFLHIAEALPAYRIDQNYLAKVDELPTAADKAAALEAMLSAELAEDGGGFVYRMLGERLQRIKQQKDASDKATEKRLKELWDIAEELDKSKTEPERLNLTQPGEYELFTVLREFSAAKDDIYLAECLRGMIGHLRKNQLLLPGWNTSKGGRQRIEMSLWTESWNPVYAQLGFDPDAPEPPPFLNLAVAELAKCDGAK